MDVAYPIVMNHTMPLRPRDGVSGSWKPHAAHTAITLSSFTPTRTTLLRNAPWKKESGPASKPGAGGTRYLSRPDPAHSVRMTEAWMLADAEALSGVVGASLEGLPHAPSGRVGAEPKEKLEQIIQDGLARHYPHRRRRRLKQDLYKELYEPLARQISLERLRGVPAYRQFEADMTDTLIKLNYAT